MRVGPAVSATSFRFFVICVFLLSFWEMVKRGAEDFGTEGMHKKAAGELRLPYFMLVSSPFVLQVTEDTLKIRFCREALEGSDRFTKNVQLSVDLEAATGWVARRTPDEVNRSRLHIINEIENAAKILCNAGSCANWLSGADPDVARLCREVNGPIMESLAKLCDFHDVAAIDLFRYGGPLVRSTSLLLFCCSSCIRCRRWAGCPGLGMAARCLKRPA